MTREEAIHTLNLLFVPCASNGNKWGCKRNEAIDMAIEALSAEAEPTQAEKCEECIHNGTNKDKINCKECASAEAIQGEWIYKTNYESVCEEWECNKCGCEVLCKTNFCPWCGARMKGGDENYDYKW